LDGYPVTLAPLDFGTSNRTVMTDQEDHDEKSASPRSQRPPEAPTAAEVPVEVPVETPVSIEPTALAVVTAERDKFKDQLLRMAADFDNYRKRSRRDVDDARQRGKDEIVRDILPVFDNLERAAQTSDTAADLRSVVDGVRMVLKLFEDTAERIGLTRVAAKNERFDPAVHEAIQQVETDEQPAGTIVTVVAAGYRFGERLVRPAMVVVARKPTVVEAKPTDPAPIPQASVRPPAAGASVRPSAEPATDPPAVPVPVTDQDTTSSGDPE
jgi:molecular chaperone GrpE